MKLIGVCRVVREPEVRYLQDGTAIATFSIVDSYKYKQKEYNNFMDVEAWGKQAEILAEYLEKGRELYVVARPKQERWETDGQKRSKLVFTIEEFKFIGGGGKRTKNEDEGDNNEKQESDNKETKEPVKTAPF